MHNERATSTRQMKLCLFACGNTTNYHMAGWRLPDAYADLGYSFERWVEIARKAEAAKFDMLFVADVISPMDFSNPNRQVFARSCSPERLDPITLLSGLAAVTTHIGLAATVATTYSQPYSVARQIGSLDLISGGRAGWNVVTGVFADDAAQYGGPCGAVYRDRVDRYAQGEEFVDVVTALWDSVKSDAFLRDKSSGIYVDPEKVSFVDHSGEHYAVRGPLSVAASPQGRPLLIQAGQSEPGRALAARIADVVFTAQTSLDLAQSYYRDIKRRALAFGRDPDSVKIMPGVMPIIGRTAAEAAEKEAAIIGLTDPVLAFGKVQMWLKQVGLPESNLDEPFGELPPTATSRSHNFIEVAKREKLTLRQVAERATMSNAHFRVTGTVEHVANTLEYWFANEGADGFNLLCPTMPGALNDFIDLLLPELRRRGLFRTEYEGRTVRENLGVPVTPLPERVPA